MIIYDLNCDRGHRFEGWFHSAADFDSQCERRLVRCPQCDSDDIQRLPSAVAIGGKHPEPAAGRTQMQQTTAMLPAGAQLMSLYRQLVDTIMSQTEDVGSSFADEARKIHYQESPERPIRGEATADEFDALRDEGIEVLRLPALKEEDLN